MQFMLFLSNSLIKNEYFILFISISVGGGLTFLIIFFSYFLAKQNPESEKLSAYECGFDPYEDARHAYNVRFCVIAIMFILFDIEIMFLLSWCVSISKLDFLGFWSVIDFLLELSLGFFYIWYVRALAWN